MSQYFAKRQGPTTPPPVVGAPSDESTAPLSSCPSPSLESGAAPAPAPAPAPTVRRPARARKRLRDSDDEQSETEEDSASESMSSEESDGAVSSSDDDGGSVALEDRLPSPSPPRAAASPSQWPQITKDAAALLQRTVAELQATPLPERDAVPLQRIASALNVLVG